MKRFHITLGMGSLLAVASAALLAPAASNAQPVESTYVACNQYNECWRVRRVYAYGEDAPITYYRSDWYEAHRQDANIHWLADPSDDRGYYTREGTWRADPAARAVQGGLTGAGVGAAIGCLVTLPIGCAPGAAVGAAVGGGTGAAVGAGTTPHN